jgi:hypothetical protein
VLKILHEKVADHGSGALAERSEQFPPEFAKTKSRLNNRSWINTLSVDSLCDAGTAFGFAESKDSCVSAAFNAQSEFRRP